MAGNAAAAQLVANGTGGRTAGGLVLRSLIQRHTQGVLDNIAADLSTRRATMRGADPTKGDLLEYINKNVGDIAKLPGMVTICDTKDKLIDALAIDLAARANSPTVEDQHRVSAASDVNNGGGGFTALDGTVYMLASANDSSALYHELIHVLSAEGGVTQLSKTKMNLNEGFTNYFAEELSTKYTKATFPAYPGATTWVRKFVTKYGRDVAYNIYFKDNEALLYSTLAATLKTNVEADKAIHDANAKDKTKNPTRFTSAAIKNFYTGATIKDAAALGIIIKKKITDAQFLEATEPSLAWMDTAIFN
jgi:hypothetical protein